MTELQLSIAIEKLLVARNLRQMRDIQPALEPGYVLRAATLLRAVTGTVIIGTGFPVAGTFETDGPVGAIALYEGLEQLGMTPWLASASPLAAALGNDYRVIDLAVLDQQGSIAQAQQALDQHQPQAVIAIERPGLFEDDRYYNMRREDISKHCAQFDHFLNLAHCPTIAIGDGGNEAGMGKIRPAITQRNIPCSVTSCDELLIADVSNWGAYGLLAFLGLWAGKDLLAAISPLRLLQYLSQRGSVDGVTRENTLTEDGLPVSEGIAVIEQLQALSQQQLEALP